jgi:penicillin amidase
MTAPEAPLQPTAEVSSAPPKPAAPMRRWPARLALAVGALVVLLADVALAGTLLVRAALPQTTGVIHVAGADGPITVTRDQYGVPHIAAQDTHDVFFAQGYVTAQDRLWQMDFNRRVAFGRLSEIFGKAEIDADRYLRTLGLGLSAQQDVDNLTPDVRAELDAYSQGVNAFIDTHKDSLPLEFRLLGYTPEPWTDSDSIAYGKVVAFSLDTAWNNKLIRAQIAALPNGTALMQQLVASYPSDNPTLTDATGSSEIAPGTSETPFAPGSLATSGIATSQIAQMAQAAAQAPIAEILAASSSARQLLGTQGLTAGSNDWVISGVHTTTGMPIVANDPHLGIQYPAIWYEIALRGGPFDEIGFSFPGVPGVVIGHNEHVAWGVTNGMVDDTDLYLEQLSPDSTTYLYNGQQLPVQTRQEVIEVAGAPSVTMTVRSTNHGPILNDVVSSLKGKPSVSLMWTALQPGYTFEGFFELGLAQDVFQLQTAISHIDISQNFVFADTDGNIGYHLSGWLPIRPAANGLLPVDGTTSANDWTGRVPFDQLPHLLNPPSGIILTANNQLTTSAYPHYITDDYDPGFRAHRIEELLSAKPQLSLDDVAAIQNDVISIPATQIAPFLVQAAQGDASAGATAARTLLTGWDGAIDSDSAAAAFYEVTVSMLAQHVIEPALGATVFKDWTGLDTIRQVYAVRQMLAQPDLLMQGTSGRDAAIRTAENDAYQYLKSHFGTADLSSWHWGDLHQAAFGGPIASAVPLLRLVLPYQTVSRPGDASTVNAGPDPGFTRGDYSQQALPSMREIIDLGNLDDSRFVTTTGESGEPFAPHNFDLLPLWNAGRYQPMEFTPAAVAADARDVLTIEP